MPLVSGAEGDAGGPAAAGDAEGAVTVARVGASGIFMPRRQGDDAIDITPPDDAA
jgi:hypothetical protein